MLERKLFVPPRDNDPAAFWTYLIAGPPDRPAFNRRGPRLRARGELVEVRAADLRFTADEAAAYLNDVMGLDLNAPDVTVLGDRTEGWIAALQLAALSMRGRDDAAGFIAHFAGDRSPRSKRVCACDRTGWAKPSPGHELTTCRRKTG